MIMAPKTRERFTAFYILDVNGMIEDYPKDLGVGENATVIIGLTNHERQTINYVVEMWLINQTAVHNDLTNETEIMYHNMWFMNKIDIMLDYVTVDSEDSSGLQWEYNYSFVINHTGSFKLMFLLFMMPTEEYTVDVDYRDIAEQKISDAYRENYLWINVS